MDPCTLARALLGQRLVRTSPSGRRVSGIIVETEAYLGVEDLAAHSVGGRRTPRNEVMYAAPGHLYVYFTYGMHDCCNVVCGRRDEPVAVLLRALEPLEGLDLMRRRRNRSGRRKSPLRDRDLCSGPARLCQAFGIDRRLNGVDLIRSGSLFLERGRPVRDTDVRVSPRIGIAGAGAWTHKDLRWYVAGNIHVSR